ncbi:hypothetical protein M9Y10_013857 [Tritrichomonas musculus]|uniref:HNH nuclease domain-containing protein n=1 Tax=Tritrichomonas musculus TaxID=1915356 RepID=A0ABR2KYV1_9EUKA
MSEQTVEFVPLNGFDDYEILNQYPFTIRRKDNHYEVNTFNDNEYISLYLNRKKYRKHVLIAKQFIINDDPEHKTVVDHINRDTTDFHLDNLRWATISANSKNKSGNKNVKYQFVQSIPNESLVINEYEVYHKSEVITYHFEDYFWFNDTFYFFNGIDYRIIHTNESKKGYKYVYLNDIDGRKVCIQISKFKKMYDLI